MGDLVKRVMAWPFVQHGMRAIGRFNQRLGSQFAAAITYFSILAMVPVVMFAFAMLGMTLTVLRPDLLDQVGNLVTKQLGDANGADEILKVIRNALEKWQAVGTVAILSAGYAGAGWIGNLRKAVDAMWRDVFDITPPGSGVVGVIKESLGNLAVLLGLLVLGALTVVTSSATSGLLTMVLAFLGIETSLVAVILLRLAGIALSLLTGWALFAYLYTTLPTEKMPFRDVARGALFGGIGLALLQFFAGMITGVFAGNATAALFGPVIVLMLSFNIFATIIMLGAAWTATAGDGSAEHPASVDQGEPGAVLLGPAALAEETGPAMVPEKVAQRGVKVGMGLGYVTGAATGIGIGAVVGRVLAGWVNWRRRRRSR